MLLRRSLEGLVLLAWLAVQYLLIVQLQRFARQGARAWRRWLDGHGSRLFLAHVHRHGGLLKIGRAHV